MRIAERSPGRLDAAGRAILASPRAPGGAPFQEGRGMTVEEFILRWTPTDTEMNNMRADLSALVAGERQRAKEQVAQRLESAQRRLREGTDLWQLAGLFANLVRTDALQEGEAATVEEWAAAALRQEGEEPPLHLERAQRVEDG